MKREGFWYSIHEPHYPSPNPHVLSVQQATSIYRLIVKKQRQARCNAQKGYTQSRINGDRLGNEEYRTKNWIWPGDFAFHYVLTHRVRPTDEFLRFIGYI